MKKIPLLVYFPGRCIVRVTVSPKATIDDLRRSTRIPKMSVDFIANGQILIEGRPFSYFRLSTGDVIVAISKKSENAEISKWMSMTRDSESFSERISSIIDPNTAREAARLRDFQMLRMERKPNCYRRLTSSLKTQLLCDSFAYQTVVVDHNINSQPNTDPLPVLWDSPPERTLKTVPLPGVSDEDALERINGIIRP